ncbi:hypothetical protein FGG08_002738 [Glutinoglossum americanum]|uniref:C2 NT-type domain-containing protein n=1 Tax=Glutinoglossum americanum TaxID=1670608 RepID=A0A9P8HZL4_9PEZI|nr:hypothetical protein FGG08_002738 [Glutinoglossum americanum]
MAVGPDVLGGFLDKHHLPKNRRPKFESTLKIIDLNNVPLVSGSSYVKWYIPFSAAAEHRGRTPKSDIKDHKVVWDYERTFQVRLTIDKNNMLQGSDIQFEVIQEYNYGARGERITLGILKLNLAEYVEVGDGEGEEGTSRRYLMRDSRINSTLKACIIYTIAITMKQLDGDRSFIAQRPPLKTAPVFGGIAGIAAVEQGDHEDSSYITSLASKSREIGETQDMYRRTLAASWAAQAGELPADECIENIFAGGDGWRDNDKNAIGGKTPHPAQGKHRQDFGDENDSGWLSDVENVGRKSQEQRRAKGGVGKGRLGGQGHVRGMGENGSMGDARGRGAHQRRDGVNGGGGRRNSGLYKISHEVDELEAREDLRCWSLPLGG